MRTLRLVLLMLTLGACALSAQSSMERIVAVVGKEIILQSDVDGQLEVFAQRDPSFKTDPAKRQQVLDALINERLMITKAAEDSIDVSEDEITQGMEQQIANLVRQFGSEQRIEQLYGMSMARIRREFRDEIRKQLILQKVRGTKFGNVKTTRSEVEAFYVKYKDSLQQSPGRYELHHIVKYVTASEALKRSTIALAESVRDSIKAGGSFADFAKRYSGDPGTAAAGGELGWVAKGKLMAAYETAAYALQPGELSEPTETPFGIHVIQLIEKRADAVNTRHILFRIGQSDEDQQRAQQALLDIKKRVEDGASFETIARTESDEKETAGFGGYMGAVEMSRMPEELGTKLAAMKDGGVTDPMPYTADPTKPGYHIIWRKEFIAPHAPTLEQDYKVIEQLAVLEKRNRLEQNYVAELRRTLYWEIKK
jgi:peptidyl-prolyl cis-trans isomerase SurA